MEEQNYRNARAEIRRMEDAWIEAYLGGDVEGFAALLTEDFVYTSERGVFDKRSYVQNLASGVIEMRTLRNSDHEVRLHGSTAISTGRATLDASFEGQDISGVDRCPRAGQRGRLLASRPSRQQRPEGGLSRR